MTLVQMRRLVGKPWAGKGRAGTLAAAGEGEVPPGRSSLPPAERAADGAVPKLLQSPPGLETSESPPLPVSKRAVLTC